MSEIARVLRPGGYLILAVERRPRRPLGLDPQRLERKLGRRGFELVEAGAAGDGSFFVGRLPRIGCRFDGRSRECR